MGRGLLFLIFTLFVFAASANVDWSENFYIPPGGRSNPYDFSSDEYRQSQVRGRRYALNYPVNVTGVLLPYEATKNFINETDINPARKSISKLVKKVIGVSSFDGLAAWLGLFWYPGADSEEFPYPVGGEESLERMGISLIERGGAVGFTYSCATCHVGQLFGRPIFGLTNRFSRANQLFIRGKKAFRHVPTALFQSVTGADADQVALYRQSRKRIQAIEAKKPVRLGLDTSLAHVALSLSHRNKDEYASFNRKFEQHPREEPLRHMNSDSKPAVWWNLKYKNRWLSDGAVISGNPIYTNILWNEIGRGTNLRELEDWFNQNEDIIADLTTAVFSTEPPLITDFFSENMFDLESAKRGEVVYEMTCGRCHGQYVKGWALPNAPELSKAQLLKTFEIRYHSRTPVVDVGTDPLRYLGIKSLVQLNDLKISKHNDVEIRESKGYVANPLLGIWARFPYMHNNAIPNLCELLEPGPKRAQTYWAGPMDTVEDFDFDCVGYRLKNPPSRFTQNAALKFDATIPGLANTGHDDRIISDNGIDRLSSQEKRDLIEYLKVL